MAKTNTNDAAQAIMAAEMEALKKISELLDNFGKSLDDVGASLDYPENFPSDSRRIITNIRNNIRMTEYEIPTLLAKLGGEAAPTTPIAPIA